MSSIAADDVKPSWKMNEAMKSFVTGAGLGVCLTSIVVLPHGLKLLPHYFVFPPHAGIFFLTYESTKNVLNYDPNLPPSVPQFLKCSAAALIGELAAATYSYPVENIVDERYAVNIGKEARKRKGVGNIASQLWKQQGLAAMYKGSGSKLICQGVASSMFFPTYELIKSHFRSKNGDSKDCGKACLNGALYGAMAGAMTGFITTPLANAQLAVSVHTVANMNTAVEFGLMWTNLSGRAKKGITRLYARTLSNTGQSSALCAMMMGLYELGKCLLTF